MEEALQTTFLVAVLQQMPAGVMIVEAPSGRVLSVNGQMHKIWPEARREAVSLEAIKRALNGEVVDPDDIPVTRGDGTPGIVRVSAAPVYDDAGTMAAAVITVNDVTHDRREQDALALLAGASESISASLAYEETIHRIAGMSLPKFAQFVFVHLLAGDGSLVRQEVAAVDPAPLEAIRNNWHGSANDAPVRQVIATGEPLFVPEVTDENWSYVADPEQRAALISLGVRSAVMVPIRVDDETYGTISFARTNSSPRFTRFDVLIARELARRAAQAVERSRLYESERRARREAEEASRAKDEFLAILSHELRTPLTTVIGWADLLKMTYHGGDAEIVHAIDALRASASIQSRLIDDLLDVSRIVAGKLTIDRQGIDLSSVVRTAAETLRLAAEKKRLKLTIEASEPIFVDADPARVQQIVTNLVTNSIKFTPEGGRIDVNVVRRDGEAEIVVTDNGVGIAPDFLPHVFERFRQASCGDSRSYTGLGLGLSIVQHVAQLHAGRVRAESEGIGRGARFTVALPIASPPPAA